MRNWEYHCCTHTDQWSLHDSLKLGWALHMYEECMPSIFDLELTPICLGRLFKISSKWRSYLTFFLTKLLKETWQTSSWNIIKAYSPRSSLVSRASNERRSVGRCLFGPLSTTMAIVIPPPKSPSFASSNQGYSLFVTRSMFYEGQYQLISKF